MSSRIKSLALLIAIVGLAVTSLASFANGKPIVNIPGDSLNWFKASRSECKNQWAPDKAFELLKKLDKIYEVLDDDAKINRNEQKIVEQFEVNQIDGDEFCTEENLEELAELSGCYHRTFVKQYDDTVTDYRRSVGNYLLERKRNFAFVCRSYVRKILNKRVEDLNETYRHDMELTLGNKLVSLKETNESLIEFLPITGHNSINPKGKAILFEFLKEKSGNNLDAKCYITTGDEGWEKFRELFQDSVVFMCRRWEDIGKEVEAFQRLDTRQKEDYTEEEATWMELADVCSDIIYHRQWLAESLYHKILTGSMSRTLKIAMKRGLKKMSRSGAKSQ